eukprot:TRINITY_DN16282_c0_g1_i1.p1 TRINITY_DN16282_c0_g1~~TRINITY_DN16282_c0_g1_i1.p1  ORF type:complete len:322 (+),score=61.67 TRINITY_DN16282_c0_g1_i1:39-1004(+)
MVASAPPGAAAPWGASYSESEKIWLYTNAVSGATAKSLPAGVEYTDCKIDRSQKYIPHPLTWQHWRAVFSERAKHWYYFDTISKNSVWKRPPRWGEVGVPTEDDETSETPSLRANSSASLIDSGVGKPAAEVVLVEVDSAGQAAEAARLAQWLIEEAETPEGKHIAFVVDSGDFGRPIAAAGVQKTWDDFTASRAKQHHIFSAVCDGVPVGHIELYTHRIPSEEVWCHWAGTDHYATLAYVYIHPSCRARRLGSAMVRQASEHAFRACGVKRVYLLQQETNLPLKRFYMRLGYKDASASFWREDEKLIALGISAEELAAAV